MPDELLQPVPVPNRVVQTVKDQTVLVLEYNQALTTANSQIGAIAEILAKKPKTNGAQ